MNEIPTFKFAIREDLQDTGLLFLPTRATPKSTGWDVKAAFEDRKTLIVNIGEHVKIPLGFRTFAPEGWWYELKPRSSTFGKKKLHSLYGTIDEDYEGQLIFACQYLPSMIIDPTCLKQNHRYYTFGPFFISEEEKSLSIEFGEPIGQIIPVVRQEMITLSISNKEYDQECKERAAIRGVGGFGSTDKKDSK